MDIIKDYLWILSAIIGIIATLIPALFKIVSIIRKFIKEKNWNLILSILPELIIEAEKFFEFTGEEKREWVISKLKVFCEENNIDFDVKKFAEEITKIINLTKEVNARNSISKKND